ncbi:MAG TPA: hypothetical protein VKZ75_12090 [Cyclobacteriaceae bacterium]|nr:hypothetical protein [Cyclobacteriaceae bacterium]
MASNQGFDSAVVADYQAKCSSNPFGFVLHPEEERTPEYARVYFTGAYEGREVVYDAVLYTLRLHHESEMYSIVEEITRKKFPEYSFQDNDNTEGTEPPEEIAMHMAETILSLEEDESVRVQEHVEMDLDSDFGIGVNVGLHVDEITDERIGGFIRDFNKGDLNLDPTLYTFLFSDSDEG